MFVRAATVLHRGNRGGPSCVLKSRYLPRIASGELRLQSMGVTEPTVPDRAFLEKTSRKASKLVRSTEVSYAE